MLPSQAQALLLDAVIRLHGPLPAGPGADLVRCRSRRGAPQPGEEIRISGSVTAREDPDTAVIAILVAGPQGRLAEASATFRLPATAVSAAQSGRPDILLHAHRHLAALMTRSAGLPALSAAVAWPCDRDSLLGPLEAARRGALRPVLVGPRRLIEATAAAAGDSLDGVEIIEADTPQTAAIAAVRLCRQGRAASLMKGSLHTDELMSAAVSREGGLRTSRRLSHVFAMDVPSYRSRSSSPMRRSTSHLT